ncbi:MAG TPA: hypothetical protein VH599_16600 [Ktedonobacterales bacterium]|jgi:hypothetical protein
MRHAKRSLLIGLSGLTLIAMFAAAFFFYGHTQAAGSDRFLAGGGTGGFTAAHAGNASAMFASEFSPNIEDQDDEGDNDGGGSQQNPPTVAPNPASNGVTTHNPGFSGFAGLNHFNTRTASGGNQFSLEPPDQGLCVGGNFVVETINDVTAVYNRFSHQIVAGPTGLNEFFRLPLAIDRGANPLVFGPFLSDPKCYFDTATGHWFMTILELDVDPATGGFTGPSHTFIAVSQTSNPTNAWSIFSIDTTDDSTNGTPSHANCPCFGDQPLIGADAFGFYITTNEFPVFANGFNGAQVYAISKFQLINAAKHAGSLPSFLQFDTGALPTPDQGGIWYSIQPATSPELHGEPNHGTEYFLSALDFFGTLDNRIAVWALTNTSAIGGPHADHVALSHVVIGSETYGQPPDARQKAGSTPLADFIAANGDPVQELSKLAGNDDRMNQVVFAHGLLYAGVNTVVQVPNGEERVGIAYFIVQPGFAHDRLKAQVHKQGYVSVAGESVLFPSIGVNDHGDALIAFTLSGPDFFPSAAYAEIGSNGRAGQVHVAGAGLGPEDSFTGYDSPTVVGFEGDGTSRWGDYSAAVAGPGGSIWFATEYIGQTCTLDEFVTDTTCGGTRTVLANWGTFIGSVNLSHH